MFRLVVPYNIRKHWHEYRHLEDISDEVFEKIRKGFESQRTDQPLVSVNIIAWNEESNILRNLSSLSAMKSSYPVEYMYVDNNSNDKTSEIHTTVWINTYFRIEAGLWFCKADGYGKFTWQIYPYRGCRYCISANLG